MYNDETQYAVYKKRLNDMVHSDFDYQNQKSRLSKEEFFRQADNLNYGKTTGVTVDGVNRMVEELEKSTRRRAEFSRRRAQYDDQDMDYINERNKHFNRKIARAFDRYTIEIRQNLERGTAL